MTDDRVFFGHDMDYIAEPFVEASWPPGMCDVRQRVKAIRLALDVSREAFTQRLGLPLKRYIAVEEQQKLWCFSMSALARTLGVSLNMICGFNRCSIRLRRWPRSGV